MAKRQATKESEDIRFDSTEMGGVLQAVKAKQGELAGYITRIEHAKATLDSLNTQREDLELQLETLKEDRIRLLAKLEEDAQIPSKKIEEAKAELDAFESKVKLAKNKLIKDYNAEKDRLEKELALVSQKWTEMERFNSEQEIILKANRDALEDDIIAQRDILTQLDVSKEEKEKDIQKYTEESTKLSGEIGKKFESLTQLDSEIETKKADLNRIALEIKEVSDIKVKKKKEWLGYFESQEKELEEALSSGKKELAKTKEELEKTNAKLAPIKKEYDEIKKAIVGFSNKQQMLTQREKALKKKYEDVGFPW